MASAPKPNAARGRGRARNFGNLGVNNQPMKKYISLTPATVETNTKPSFDSFKPVEESLEHSLRETTQGNLVSCLSKTNEFATSEEKIKRVVSLLFERCLGQRDLAVNGGQVVAMLISSKIMEPTFRNMFFKKFQETYKNREEQRKTEFDKFLCFSVFLCSIYKDVRINDGQVLTILTKPAYTMLGELLDDKAEDVSQREKGMEVFCDNLFMVASLLQESDKGQMDELFNKVRTKIIQETSPTISCILLEAFEHFSSGDWTVKEETKAFYCDLMSNIKAKS